MIREIPITEAPLSANATIWDVRDAKAYAEGHISQARNQPIDALSAELLASVPADEPIYVLCGGGSKAPRAAAVLHELDSRRDIVILSGGTRGAKAAGMTIISEAELSLQ